MLVAAFFVWGASVGGYCCHPPVEEFAPPVFAARCMFSELGLG